MTRLRLLLAALILCAAGASIALAVTGTLTYSITPSGGTVACDVGPPAPFIPAAAQKAGFTHCAFNMDFTDNSGVTVGGGIVMNSPATYVAECGASPFANNTLWHIVWHNSNPYQEVAGPCSRFVIANDPVSGKKALDLHYLNSDWTTNQGSNGTTGGWQTLGISWPSGQVGNGPCGSTGQCAGGPYGTGLPQNGYNQMTFRFTSNTFNTTAGTDTVVSDWWFGQCDGCQVSSSTEIDFFETHTNQGGNGAGANPGGAISNYLSSWGVDMTQYQTMGHLMTSADQLNTYFCSYFPASSVSSGSPVGVPCKSISTPNSCCTADTPPFPTNQDMDKEAILWIGGNDCFGHQGCEVNGAEIFVQNWQLWMCPNYWTSDCRSGPITSENAAPERPAWYERFARWLEGSFVSSAYADYFDSPYEGEWVCPDGSVSEHDYSPCMPPEFKGVEWWKACVAGRDDCVWSHSAFVGFSREVGKTGRALRGDGYCYTKQRFTCWPDGKPPQ